MLVYTASIEVTQKFQFHLSADVDQPMKFVLKQYANTIWIRCDCREFEKFSTKNCVIFKFKLSLLINWMSSDCLLNSMFDMHSMVFMNLIIMKWTRFENENISLFNFLIHNLGLQGAENYLELCALVWFI